MSRRGRWWALGLAAGALWAIGLGVLPLFESTEGRYGSIAAAMLRSGDWLEPRFNGLLHLSKPPLAYWAGAASLALLPDGEFAVRLPATLAWLACAWLVLHLGLALGLDRRRAGWAAWLSGSAPLAMIQGHLLSSDVFLALGVLMVYLGVLGGGNNARRALWSGLGLALGLLAKGHMVLFWTWLPLAAWAVLVRQPHRLAPLVHPLALAIFLGLGTPWFLVELRRHPGLLDYWLHSETAARYLSTSHGRAEPWWYFIALLPLSVLPWAPEAARGLWRGIRGRRAWSACLLWTLLPLVLLSGSGSKRPNYLLPLVPPLALLAAAQLRTPVGLSLRLRSGIWVLLALLAPLAMTLRPDWLPPTRDLLRSASPQAPLVAYGVLPSSLEFYRGGPVPVLGRRPAGVFDPESTLARWAPRELGAVEAALEASGSVLARRQDRPALEARLGRSLQRRAAAGKLELLTALPNATGPAP